MSTTSDRVPKAVLYYDARSVWSLAGVPPLNQWLDPSPTNLFSSSPPDPVRSDTRSSSNTP